MKTQAEEHVIIVQEDGVPTTLVRPNGSVKYYKLTEMNYQEHVEFLGADNVQPL